MTDFAGVGLGAPSLAMHLFEACLAGFRIFTRAKNLGKDAGVQQAALLIQEQLLVQWGDELGLTNTRTDGNGNELDSRLKTETSLFHAVVAGLTSIKAIFVDTEKLRQRYGITPLDQLGGNDGRVLTELATERHLLEGNFVIQENTRRQEAAEAAHNAFSKFSKLRWAVIDKSKCEEFVAQLKSFIDGLYSLLPPLHTRDLAKAILAELLRTADAEKLSSLQIAAQGSSYLAVASAAELKRLTLTVQQDPAKVDRMDLIGGSDSISNITHSKTCTRSLGSYTRPGEDTSQPILIEWKAIDPSSVGELREVLELRVNSLGFFLHQQVKPSELRALTCLGHFKGSEGGDDPRYGLVYSLPPTADPSKLPTSLFDLLPEGDDDCTFEPDLGDKFKLAYVLAYSVYELHASNWLHKGIRSENILYLARRGSRGLQSVTTPYLAGYEFARTDRLREATQKARNVAFDLYSHPLYRHGTVRYRRLFDLYSLGVVLLEIGCWRRVQSGYESGLTQTPEQFREILIETCISELGPAVGAIYRDAVRCCLEGNFPVDGLADNDEVYIGLPGEEIEAADSRINGELTVAFWWKVVKMLGKCTA